MGRPMVVTKVGRKLVTVEEYGRPFQYRIETGQANDQYGHEWLVTEAERDAGLRANEARAFLRSLGLDERLGFRPSSERLVEIADRLKDLEPER